MNEIQRQRPFSAPLALQVSDEFAVLQLFVLVGVLGPEILLQGPPDPLHGPLHTLVHEGVQVLHRVDLEGLPRGDHQEGRSPDRKKAPPQEGPSRVQLGVQANPAVRGPVHRVRLHNVLPGQHGLLNLGQGPGRRVQGLRHGRRQLLPVLHGEHARVLVDLPLGAAHADLPAARGERGEREEEVCVSTTKTRFRGRGARGPGTHPRDVEVVHESTVVRYSPGVPLDVNVDLERVRGAHDGNGGRGQPLPPRGKALALKIVQPRRRRRRRR
mmetsp:Transcript_3166/g.10967  ORF Transcript_3166/g.10967 Transcript_3166/m.10967 type:complete len:270 (+) Transcript_3166:29-838(+)